MLKRKEIIENKRVSRRNRIAEEIRLQYNPMLSKLRKYKNLFDHLDLLAIIKDNIKHHHYIINYTDIDNIFTAKYITNLLEIERDHNIPFDILFLFYLLDKEERIEIQNNIMEFVNNRVDEYEFNDADYIYEIIADRLVLEVETYFDYDLKYF